MSNIINFSDNHPGFIALLVGALSILPFIIPIFRKDDKSKISKNNFEMPKMNNSGTVIINVDSNNSYAQRTKDIETFEKTSKIQDKRNELIKILSLFLNDINEFNEYVANMSTLKFNDLLNVLDTNVINTTTLASKNIRFNSENEKQMVEEIIQKVNAGKFDYLLEIYF